LRNIGFFEIQFSDEELIEQAKYDLECEKNFKSLTCVNCWNKSNSESTTLWNLYSDINKGIMIKSTISKLIKSLELTKEEINLSEIKYLDYRRQLMSDNNIMFSFIHKQASYRIEDEVRLIYQIEPETGIEYDWAKDEVEKGLFIKTNLDKLIEEIIISPNAESEFFDLVQDTLKNNGLKKTINRSQLSL